MADTVTSQTLVDGNRNVVMKFTNVSDSTGEAAVTKVTASALAGAPSNLRIDKIYYSTNGMAVQVLWDATTPVLAWVVPSDGSGEIDFRSFGGIQNDAGAGKTGNIKFTTVGHAAGDSYAIILHLSKV